LLDEGVAALRGLVLGVAERLDRAADAEKRELLSPDARTD
jgi:hypothetical protein